MATAVDRRISTFACSSLLDRALRHADTPSEFGLAHPSKALAASNFGCELTSFLADRANRRDNRKFCLSVVADHFAPL